MALPPKTRARATTTGQAKSQAWQAWRIADGRFDVFSPVGASLVGGRWNSPGLGVIYASRSYAGAMLECLAHAGIGRVPKTHVAIEIAIAAAVSVEQQGECSLPVGWDHADLHVARAFGDAWIRERRTAVLVVPSVVARREVNVLLNPRHADFKKIVAGSPEPVVWDARLFRRHWLPIRTQQGKAADEARTLQLLAAAINHRIAFGPMSASRPRILISRYPVWVGSASSQRVEAAVRSDPFPRILRRPCRSVASDRFLGTAVIRLAEGRMAGSGDCRHSLAEPR
jgi:RES domain-containing protein